MFVDGQWDVTTLAGLEDQTFIYFAAEDDTNAYNGMTEVMNMFDEDGVSYAYAQWDGNYTPDELSDAAAELFNDDVNAYFVSWETGTIDANTASFGGNSERPQRAEDEAEHEDAASDASSKPDFSSGDSEEGKMGGQGAGMASVGYHMASFDYAYNCVAVMEWLFEQ